MLSSSFTPSFAPYASAIWNDMGKLLENEHGKKWRQVLGQELVWNAWGTESCQQSQE